MPNTTNEDTQRRLAVLEEDNREHTVTTTTIRAQWVVIAALGTLGLGVAGTAGSVLLQDRSRIDVLESKQRDMERAQRDTQAEQRALSQTLSDLRTELRVIGARVDEVRERSVRIEAQLTQPTLPPHRLFTRQLPASEHA